MYGSSVLACEAGLAAVFLPLSTGWVVFAPEDVEAGVFTEVAVTVWVTLTLPSSVGITDRTEVTEPANANVLVGSKKQTSFVESAVKPALVQTLLYSIRMLHFVCWEGSLHIVS